MVGISLYSITPVRAQASEAAEQNTQILFGETFEIVEQQPRWNKVRLHSDGQEGWIDAKMCTPMKEKEYKAYHAAYGASMAMVVMPMAYAVSENNNQTIPLTAGTRLAKYKEGRFEVFGVGFRIDPKMVITQPMELNQPNLMQAVRFFLNVPYLWGGKNALGMDCSGFTQVVMSLFGKTLPRNASEQATQGEEVANWSEIQAGDLLFFDHEDGKISHVGMAIERTLVIHCSGRVKVGRLDETGIYDAETATYSHYLVTIRRI